jgi:putative membrane protein insertion efficiency factor
VSGPGDAQGDAPGEAPGNESGSAPRNAPGNLWVRACRAVCIGLIRGYQVVLSPLVGGHCRFYPSCSQYAVQAYRDYSPMRATAMTFSRICRCHPLNKGGYDPVPPPPAGGDAPRDPS